MKLRYEGHHDSVIVQTAEDADGIRGYVVAERGDEVDIATEDVHARLAGGWVQVNPRENLPEEIIVGTLTVSDEPAPEADDTEPEPAPEADPAADTADTSTEE